MDTNVLYYGDNLEILHKYIPDSSIDLIYLDPPFNSKATYNVLYKEPSGKSSQAQIEAFEDTWEWTQEGSARALQQIATSTIASAEVKEFISVLPNFVGQRTPMRAYLTMMAVRLIELRRVLKDTGSIYLHCDPTASHYLKLLLDTIFGVQNFRNEIIWKRNFTKKGSQFEMTRLANNADILLFYGKSDKVGFKTPKVQLPSNELKQKYSLVDKSGRRFKSEPLELPRMMARTNLVFEFMGYTPLYGWMMTRDKLEELQHQDKIYITKNGKPRRRNFLDEYEGTELDNIWIDISPLGQMQSEALGYPTQKPEALLERIIQASSNEGDIVLDPFCGCGTAVVAAQRLNRKWIGIDVTHLAIGLMKWRFNYMTPPASFKVIGEPEDPAGAEELAKADKYQFQWWAVHKIGGQPYGDKKKGADTGIDGYLYYMDEKDKIKKAIISVKGGHNATVSMIRDLGHVIDREKSDIGVFITLDKPTRPMIEEAALKGFYHSPNGRDYPRIQILTIEENFQGKTADTPSWLAPIPKAPPVKKAKGKTARML